LSAFCGSKERGLQVNIIRNLYMRRGICLISGLLIGGATKCGATEPQTVNLVSHRAIYDLTLVPSDNRSDWDSVHGRLVYELIGSQCTKLTQNFRQVLKLSGPKNGERILDNYSTSSESADGKSIKFVSKEMDRDGIQQVTSGNTEIKENGITVYFSSPTKSEYTLKQNTFFPISYTRELIKNAKINIHFLSALQFDGTDQAKPVQDTLAVIGEGQRGSNGLNPILKQDDFETLKRWPVTISYRTAGNREAIESDYTVFEELFENGVVQSLILDFKDFKLSGKLVDINFPVDPSCQ